MRANPADRYPRRLPALVQRTGVAGTPDCALYNTWVIRLRQHDKADSPLVAGQISVLCEG